MRPYIAEFAPRPLPRSAVQIGNRKSEIGNLINPLAFLREIRAPYFAAVALPILLGSAIAWWERGRLDVGLFALSLVAGVFLQAGANMGNDYFDYGAERQPGAIIPPEQVLQGALGFGVVGAMVGLYVALATGPLILVFGLIGVVSGFLYSVPPIHLGGKGIGELLAGVALGLLTTVGSYFVHSRAVAPVALWAALPVALMMTAVLVLNGFQPEKLAAGRSLWARLGAQRALAAYSLPAMVALALLIVGVAAGHLPQLALLALLALPLSSAAAAAAATDRLSSALLHAVAAHLALTSLLALAFLLDRWLAG